MADKSFWSDKKDKEWYRNFWFYYKYYIYAIIATIIVIIISAVQCSFNVTPDISIDYICYEYLGDASKDNLIEYFTPKINDIDGQDGKNINIIQHTLTNEHGQNNDNEMTAAMQQAIILELTLGECYAYILDDAQFEFFKDKGVLMDLSEISDLEKGTYSLEIHNNKLFRDLTLIDYDKPVHFCVRAITPALREKEIPLAKAMQDNAIIIFNEFKKASQTM